jgi:hypothetical protein
MGDNIDFELVLPYVINRFLPAGLVGILLAGLLAAFMATFSATVNAGAAYLVNDLYKRYLNPNADNRTLVRFSYLASVVILAGGIGIGFFVSSITSITQWIVAGLYGGYTAANVLKWYWWRLNGHGYFAGMVVGLTSALVVPTVLPMLAPAFHDPTYSFPFILLFSAIACVAGSLLTAPVDQETLKNFYRNVRPWGFWKPVHAMVLKDDPSIEPNRDAARDLLNCGVGICWQLTLVAAPLYIIFRDLRGTLISLTVLVVTSIFLKKFWYNRLKQGEIPTDKIDSDALPAAAELAR